MDAMLQQGVIEPAQSERRSPVVLVPKPNGSWWLGIKNRRLNAITIPEKYPIPKMDDCLDSLGETT